MINWDVEKSLFLISVKIHSHEAINASYTKKISYEFCTDGYTGLVFSVLTGPTEVGDDSDDAFGRSSFGSINHQEKFHQIVRVGER